MDNTITKHVELKENPFITIGKNVIINKKIGGLKWTGKRKKHYWQVFVVVLHC